jgi:hypothetical protein
VSVGFEVDADVEAGRRVVQVLDACRGAHDVKIEVVVDIVGRGTVGVGCLDDTDEQTVGEAALAAKVGQEGGGESCDAVAVEELEAVVFGRDEVVD